MDIYSTVSTRKTPQREQADIRQVKNSAGGYVFALDDEDRLRRFLTLGSEGGTYYAGAKDLTLDNAAVLTRMAKTQPVKMVEIIREISVAGRAPKANPALFALAVVASVADEVGRKAAFAVVPDVVRIGTHLFLFTGYLTQFRGWGRAARRAVANWYLEPSVEDVAYQMVKYRQREGWGHGDLLRLSHPKTVEDERNALFGWTLGKETSTALPALVSGFLRLQEEGVTVNQALEVIRDLPITWEMLPVRLLSERAIWEALVLKGMPITALMRQLPRLTNLHLLHGTVGRQVVERLTDVEVLRKGRVHPINVLVAQRTYASGHSARGDGSWTPERRVVDALDEAFYLAFGTIQPTGKRTLLALDVSGSMGSAISNMPISCREAAAAMAMVTARVEDDYEIVGFTGDGGWSRRSSALTPLAISPRQRLDDVLKTVNRMDFGVTDCAMPMTWATKEAREFDTFAVYTDNETWAGTIHPHQALAEYRRRSGIAARSVVVGMTSTGFTIADPNDPGMLDVAGFDSAVPNVISDFARGL